jgi:hypothetical protein
LKVNIVKELAENRIILLLVPSVEYTETSISVTKALSKKQLGYITLNKTYAALSEQFKGAKVNVDNMLFVDAISKTIKTVPDQVRGCYFVDSPSSLTDLSLNISKMIDHKFEYVIFDSLTNLLIYQGKAPVARFLSTIINKMRDAKVGAVFFCLDVKAHEELIEEASMFVDKVIKVK